MIRLITPILIAGVLLAGCSSSPQSSSQDPHYSAIVPSVATNETDKNPVPTDLPLPVQEQPPVEEEPYAGCPDESEESYTLKATPEVKEEEPAPIVEPKEPPGDRTWISPGKVQVGNFYLGAIAEWNLLVHNGEDEKRQFSITYRRADRVMEGFGFAPGEAKDWVIIADADPVLAPKETREILIVLDLPVDAVVPPKWEFWIAVKDVTERKMVSTALCSRWLIYMQ